MLSGTIASAILVTLAVPAQAKTDHVPDWVSAAAAQTLPHYSPETNAVVLLEDTTYTVAPDGKAVEHVRRVVKILRPQGRNEATVHVSYDKDTTSSSTRAWAGMRSLMRTTSSVSCMRRGAILGE
jgi:hypothetical protein